MLVVLVAAALGVPQGLSNVTLQSDLYRQADPERMGASAGLLRTFHYLGAIASSAVGGHVFAGGHTAADLHELAAVMLGGAALFVVLLVLRPAPVRRA